MDAKLGVVIGTGLHKQHLKPNAENPLADWGALLKQTAIALGVTVKHALVDHQRFAVAWEELILKLAESQLKRSDSPHLLKSAAEIEQQAIDKALSVLARHAWDYPRSSRVCSALRSQHVGDIFSLNFDTAWVAPDQLKSDAANAKQKSNLKWFKEVTNGPRIWFPNGHLGSRERINLGLRKFGLQPGELEQARRSFKQWDVKNNPSSEERLSEQGYLKLMAQLPLETDEPACHWVTHFMLRPLLILGVGLSAEEQGLWWILGQRARNLTKVRNKPPVRILLNMAIMERTERHFWAAEPLGIRPLWCTDWTEGWEHACDLIERGDLSS